MVKFTTSVPLTDVISLGVQQQKDTEEDGDSVKVRVENITFNGINFEYSWLICYLFLTRLAQDDNVAEEQGKSHFLTVYT